MSEEEEFLLRREFENWKRDVYEYRQAVLEKQLVSMMAVMDRLSSIADKAENVSQHVAKFGESLWTRTGVIAAGLLALVGAIDLAYRIVTRGG